MLLKQFGKQSTRVSEIGMGTYYDPAWIAMAFFGWRNRASQKVEAIRTGINEGMTLIDTAEIYLSEPLVAKAISGIEREKLFIATKVWPNHLRRESLRRSLDKSLQRLGLSYVDLYQVHWPNKRVLVKETMSTMEELVVEGKVRYIGVCNFTLAEIKEAAAALERTSLASVQMSYSLLDRSIEKDILPYCNKEGIAVLAYYPLGHGKLANMSSRISKFCQRYSKTPAQIALRWLASKQNVFPIPRASTPNHVEENAGASGWELTQADISELEEVFPA